LTPQTSASARRHRDTTRICHTNPLTAVVAAPVITAWRRLFRAVSGPEFGDQAVPWSQSQSSTIWGNLMADQVRLGIDPAHRPVTAPRTGVTLIAGDPCSITAVVRTIALHHAQFPATQLWVFDGAGELDAFTAIAHRYRRGHHDDPHGDPQAAVAADLVELRAELDRRTGPPADPAAHPRTAGIDPGRADTEIHGLHPIVVVIDHLARYLTGPHTAAVLDHLHEITARGRAANIHLVLSVTAPGLEHLPTALINAARTRIVMRLPNTAANDRVLGGYARDVVDATKLPTGWPWVAWLVTENQEFPPTSDRLVNVYHATEADARTVGAAARAARRIGGRLTGHATTATGWDQ
jgi:hypothetical protein